MTFNASLYPKHKAQRLRSDSDFFFLNFFTGGNQDA